MNFEDFEFSSSKSDIPTGVERTIIIRKSCEIEIGFRERKNKKAQNIWDTVGSSIKHRLPYE